MILDTAERIKYYTETGLWGEETLLDIFRRHVGNYKGKVCMVDPLNKEELVGLKPDRLSYEELDRIVDTVATNLIEKGIQKDDIIIVQLPNIWELAMAYLAIARAGAVISPMAVQWRSRELEYIAKTTNAKMYISTDNFRGFNYLKMVEEVRPKCPNLRHIVSLKEFKEMAGGKIDEARLQKVKPSANDVFTICWTSGTEADPKGCPLTHNNWIAHGKNLAGVSQIKEGAIQMCNAPLVNMSAIGVVYNTWLLRGGTFVLHHPFDWDLAYKQIVEEKVNTVLLVPALLHMILRHPRTNEYDLRSLSAVTTGSTRPSPWSFLEFKKRWGIEIVNLCGGNEGALFCAGPKEVPDLEKRTDHLPWWGKKGGSWEYGKGVESKIVDENRKELTEVGAIGELAYKGPNMIPCYFNRPDITEHSFDKEGFYYTGDLFQILEDNFLQFFDRKKDMIIRGGFNISAQEVESILQDHPKIADIAAIAMPDVIMGEKICVYVVPRKDQKVTLEELSSFIAEKGAATYKRPERLEIVDVIPRNPVGKILKTKLREDLAIKMNK